ncbi:hypothetical protein AB0K34_13990 [Actinomadura sp. NPDC049382]|uniref:hypothetical protein n=1 Tax=Actinomadura sp. NPDC049382 TaxID=3158220 RepID=UPI00341EEF24
MSERSLAKERSTRPALILLGLSGLGANTAITLWYRARYKRLLRIGVERCQLVGRDPEQWLLGVIADIQSAQKFPVRSPHHRLEARWVQQELDRVTGRRSAEI